MSTFERAFEEGPKQKVLDLIDAAVSRGEVPSVVGEAAKGIVKTLPHENISIHLNGSDEASGYCHLSWHGHSEELKDVPTDVERKLPNEAGYDRDPETNAPIISDETYHPEWAGMRTRAMSERLGRPAKV